MTVSLDDIVTDTLQSGFDSNVWVFKPDQLVNAGCEYQRRKLQYGEQGPQIFQNFRRNRKILGARGVTLGSLPRTNITRHCILHSRLDDQAPEICARLTVSTIHSYSGSSGFKSWPEYRLLCGFSLFLSVSTYWKIAASYFQLEYELTQTSTSFLVEFSSSCTGQLIIRVIESVVNGTVNRCEYNATHVLF